MVAVFINPDSGDTTVYKDLETFKRCSDRNLTFQENDLGDLLVIRPNNSPWGKTIGIIQIRGIVE